MDLGLTSEMVVRVALAVALGAAIGLQREIDDQPAGLRTHLAVALGASLFGVISTLGFSEFEAASADTNVQVDVTRVASQVVVGIGFLGAGVIFRRGGDVQNLTTAATLWATAAVGLAAGVGDGGIAMFSAALLVVVLAVLRIPRDWIRRRFTRQVRTASVRLVSGADPAGFDTWLGQLEGARVEVVSTEKHDGRLRFRVRVDADPGRTPEQIVAPLVRRHEIDDVRFLEAPADG
ncbi:MgtC/SapB family protein [Actinospongicola halichondriae]|uniref:MgtC/SapB family protein n=1 Tax=Actinospongicola halichondriae TaxID=3236844 RepID=UPI003D5227AE